MLLRCENDPYILQSSLMESTLLDQIELKQTLKLINNDFTNRLY
jgi:hypothetical protein